VGGARRDRSTSFDTEALEHLGSLQTLSRRLVHNRSEADDLVQDAYVRALRSADGFTPGTNLRAWLQTILRNLVKNRHRDSYRSRVRPNEEELTRAADDRVSDQSSPEQLLLNEVVGPRLRTALESLPKELRDAVWLRDVEEMSYADMAHRHHHVAHLTWQAHSPRAARRTRPPRIGRLTLMTCRELDSLITPFVDGECSEEDRATIIAHLRECDSCRVRVEAESTASHVLHAHAAVARTMGATPSWRPRVFRLGQPMLPAPASLLLILTLASGSLLALWMRPVPIRDMAQMTTPAIDVNQTPRPVTIVAEGVIGDSFCEHFHRFSARFNTDDHECTLGCVRRGAEFMLVTETQAYRIRNQELPQLAQLANLHVKIEGTMDGDAIVIAKMAEVDPYEDPRVTRVP
jgi:RNA polymerase sigma factor (sigma-70 family)